MGVLDRNQLTFRGTITTARTQLRVHGESAAVKKFAGILYPKCLAPVELIEYKQIDANAAFRRVQAVGTLQGDADSCSRVFFHVQAARRCRLMPGCRPWRNYSGCIRV